VEAQLRYSPPANQQNENIDEDNAREQKLKAAGRLMENSGDAHMKHVERCYCGIEHGCDHFEYTEKNLKASSS
jgi:hypothetical protein